MSGQMRVPFVFVPEGEPVPGEVHGPDWVSLPATFVPEGDGQATASGQPWPRDRLGRPWGRDRRGNPVCPLTELPPGGPVPGENALDAPDPVAAYRATEAVFRDPAAAAGLVRTAAAGGRGNAGGSGQIDDSVDSSVPTAPSAPFNPEANDIGNPSGESAPAQYGPPAPSQTLRGGASYYPPTGHPMANRQPYDPNAMTAAMRHVAFGTVVTVTLASDPSRSVTVTVTDRGPYVAGRVIDLTPAAFVALVGSTAPGVVNVVVTVP
jgi:hypothetical protein